MADRRPTNQPIFVLGRASFRPTPILSLAFIQAACRAELEVDLSSLPPLISGGDRKARAKAIGEQQSSFRVTRRIERYRYADPSYGSLACSCRHCKHIMYIDDDADELFASGLSCDRCHRPAF